MARRTAQLAVIAVALAACNALTGVGDLSEEAQALGDGGVDVAAPVPTTTTTSTTPPPPPPPPVDAADADAGMVDADADAFVPDTFVPPPVCVPATTPVRYGVDVAITTLTGINWTDAPGARVPDNEHAHTNGGPDDPNKNTLTTKNYGFSLPSSAVIKGIEVKIHRTAAGGEVKDGAVTLVKGAPKSGQIWPSGPNDGPYPIATYGSASDLWSASWGAADINSAGFSVSLRADGEGDGHVDAIGVVVHYCVPQ